MMPFGKESHNCTSDSFKLTNHREFFSTTEAPRIWDGHQNRWVTRSQCILDGPAFINLKTVLARSYGKNALLNSFFSTILDIPSLTIEDIFQEIEWRRDKNGRATELSLVRDIYAFLASKASSDEDWRVIK
jgi:hypothetical protein